MSGLDEKGLEAARAAFYGPKGSVVAAISAYLAATTPTDVGEEPVAWRIRCVNPRLAKQPGYWVLLEKRPTSVQAQTSSYEIEPLYSATALERVTRERDEARADHEWMTANRNKWQDAATIARRRAESAEAKLAEALADRAAQAERMARLEEALRHVRSATYYPVSTEINPKGWAWHMGPDGQEFVVETIEAALNFRTARASQEGSDA